jgi:hypothetical protein
MIVCPRASESTITCGGRERNGEERSASEATSPLES